MSDNNQNDDWRGPNAGITLPQGANATYNTGLSPLFINRNGKGGRNSAERMIIWRGADGYLWSRTPSTEDQAYWFAANDTHVRPSSNNTRAYPFSLRCLVSTTNSYIIKRTFFLKR